MAINEEKGRQLLLRSLEESLSAEEQAELLAALAGSENLRREQQQLGKMRSLLANLQPPTAPDFPDRLMIQLRERQQESRIITWVTRVAAACLLIVALALLNLYWTEGSLDTDTILGLESLSPNDALTLMDY